MTVCTFAGHREVFLSSVNQDIDHTLSELVQSDIVISVVPLIL